MNKRQKKKAIKKAERDRCPEHRSYGNPCHDFADNGADFMDGECLSCPISMQCRDQYTKEIMDYWENHKDDNVCETHDAKAKGGEDK